MFFVGYCYNVNVSQIDLDSSTGNTIYNNNTIYISSVYIYPTGEQTLEYTTSGDKCLCGEFNYSVTSEIYYYQNDVMITSVVSSYTGGVTPCIGNPLSCCNQIEIQICLTDEGTSSLGPTLEVYSNPVSLYDFGTFIDNVSKTSITGNNYPFNIIVPDDTTTIRIYDPISNCYIDVIITPNNVCTNCDLSLDSIGINLTGVVNAGVLTGTCDSNITNYRMAWYGPDNINTLSFISGVGTEFPGWTVSHPITNSNSPSLSPGMYVVRIIDVELNGIKYSYSGGTGTGIVLSEVRGCYLTTIVT